MKLTKKGTLREKAKNLKKNANKMYSEVEVSDASPQKDRRLSEEIKEEHSCDEISQDSLKEDEGVELETRDQAEQEEVHKVSKKVKGPQDVSLNFETFLINFTHKEESILPKTAQATVSAENFEEFLLPEDHLPSPEEVNTLYVTAKLEELFQKQAEDQIEEAEFTKLLGEFYEDERKYSEFYEQHLARKQEEEEQQRQEEERLKQVEEQRIQDEQEEKDRVIQQQQKRDQYGSSKELEKEVPLFEKEEEEKQYVNEADCDNLDNKLQKPNEDTRSVSIESLEGLCQALKHLKVCFTSEAEIQVFDPMGNSLIRIDKGKFIDDLFSLPNTNSVDEGMSSTYQQNLPGDAKEAQADNVFQEQNNELVDLDKELLGDNAEQFEKEEVKKAPIEENEDDEFDDFYKMVSDNIFEAAPIPEKLPLKKEVSRSIEEEVDEKPKEEGIEKAKASHLPDLESSNQQYIIDHKGRKQLSTVNFSNIPAPNPKGVARIRRQSTHGSSKPLEIKPSRPGVDVHKVEVLLSKSKSIKPENVMKKLNDMNFGSSHDQAPSVDTKKPENAKNKSRVVNYEQKGTETKKVVNIKKQKTNLDDIQEEESVVSDVISVQDNPKPTTDYNALFQNLEGDFDEFDDLDEFEKDLGLCDEPEEDERPAKTKLGHIVSVDIEHSNPLEPLISQDVEGVDYLDLDFKRVTSMAPLAVHFELDKQAKFEVLARTKSNTEVVKLSKRVKKLESKLEKAKTIIQEKEESLQLMKKLNTGQISEQDEREVHFAFMFASPLVRIVSGKPEKVMLLNCSQELQDVYDVVRKVDYKLKFKSGVATTINFRSMLTDRPYVLHFSGHGLENTAKVLQNDYFMNQDKGNILLLEDEQCDSMYYFEQDLKKLLEECKYKFEVVFVSSCHSERVGQVFLNAGAKHVICIQQSETISDTASLKFARVFYETLFAKKLTVCQAYNIAKNSIKEDMTASEASKYILKTQEDIKGLKTHKCAEFLVKREGGFIDKTIRPIYADLPSPIKMFKGRQLEMSEIIKLLREFRVVSVLGAPGIGKFTLVRNLANHLIHRNVFEDGIIYIRLKAFESTSKFLTRLALKISIAMQDQQEKSDLDVSSDDSELNFEKDHDKNLKENEIIDELKNKSVLIILGNIEDTIDYDHDQFNKKITSLLQSCPKLKLLLCSRKAPNLSFETEAREFYLQSMTNKEA